MTERPEPTNKQEKIEWFLAKENKDPKDWYQLARWYIRAGQFKEARNSLENAQDLQEARLQLGFLDLWEGRNEEARVTFEKELCEVHAMLGLERVAGQIRNDKKKRKAAIQIYRKLLACDPKNPDTLFFLGLLLYREGRWDEAERLLREALVHDPKNQDAQIQLANLYAAQKKWCLAEEIYLQFPCHCDAQLGLARIYAAQMRYREAKPLYPRCPEFERELFETESHTNPGTALAFTHTAAKENDPTLRVPVVKDYYTFATWDFFVPIFDRWRLDARALWYHQKENDIFPPVGVNYSAYLTGAQLTSHYYFAPGWRWDVVARGFGAWPAGHMTYPFQNTTRFEPGTTLVYNQTHLFVADAHIESFIIKNFARGISQLLRTDYVQTAYGYHPDVFMHPKMEFWVRGIWYHDSIHNDSNYQSARAEIDLYTPLLTTYYLFEHSGFRRVTQNYFSYLQQLRYTLGLKFHKDFTSRLYFEVFWEHNWQLTYNLIMPIGDFIFIAARQYLIGNRVQAKMSYRFRDMFRIEMGGHYNYTSLPYRDWNLNGSLLWQF